MEHTFTTAALVRIGELLSELQRRMELENPGLGVRCGCWMYYPGIGDK